MLLALDAAVCCSQCWSVHAGVEVVVLLLLVVAAAGGSSSSSRTLLAGQYQSNPKVGGGRWEVVGGRHGCTGTFRAWSGYKGHGRL